MVKIKNTWNNIKRKVWLTLVDHSIDKWYYLFLYRSYWNYITHKHPSEFSFSGNFLTAIPNNGAGVGHQASNILAGIVYAPIFNLTFAYTPILDSKWDCILGFGKDEISVAQLIKSRFKLVRLPKFHEDNIEIVHRIIRSYCGQRVVFRLEQDQFCKNIYLVKDQLRLHFCKSATSLLNDLCFSHDFLNIAIHVRRGDIVQNSSLPLENQKHRWLSNEYYVKTLKKVMSTSCVGAKPVKVFLFTQGEECDFQEFKSIPNLIFKLNMDPYATFIHLVKADILLMSLSSFSFIAGLYNDGLKVCPSGFWHAYPDSPDWMEIDNENFK